MFRLQAAGNPVSVASPTQVPEEVKLWKELEAALTETLTVIRTPSEESSAKGNDGAPHRAPAPASRLQWYTRIYATVTRRSTASEFLYDKFYRFVEADLKTNVTAPIMQMYRDASSSSKSQTTASSDLLMFTTIGKHYEHFCVFRKYSCLVLGYLDSHYTQRQNKLSISDLMNFLFFQIVYVNVRDALATVVLAQIKKYRDGATVPMQSLQDAIRMLFEISTISPGPTDVWQLPKGAMLAARDQNITGKSKLSPKEGLLDNYIAETGKYYLKAAENQMSTPTQGFITWCGQGEAF